MSRPDPFLSCQCGKRFRSYGAEAYHRHNFPLLCRRAKPSRRVLIYYWDGRVRLNGDGWRVRVILRSDGKELEVSAKRIGELMRQGRLNLTEF